jgi:hypothetical protein
MRTNDRWSRDSHEGLSSKASAVDAVASTTSIESTHHTIALFGAGSKTATHFLRLALDAGYHIRALMIQQSASDNHHGNLGTVNTDVAAIAQDLKEEFTDRASALHWVRADTIYDARACKRVLRGVDYVVCMMNDAPVSCYVNKEAYADKKKGVKSIRTRRNSSASSDLQSQAYCNNPSKPITSFVQMLYPLMKDIPSIQVFLYQVSMDSVIHVALKRRLDLT